MCVNLLKWLCLLLLCYSLKNPHAEDPPVKKPCDSETSSEVHMQFTMICLIPPYRCGFQHWICPTQIGWRLKMGKCLQTSTYRQHSYCCKSNFLIFVASNALFWHRQMDSTKWLRIVSILLYIVIHDTLTHADYSCFPFSAIQIHYTGRSHWVTSACRMGEVKLIDSKVKSTLPSSLKEQLAHIYGEFSTKDGILVSRIPCQQQESALDCGLFSIATAYHMARGDAPQRFDQSLMRQHLMACFEKQALSPFLQVAGKKLLMKHLFIPVHCICKMAESYGSKMIQCDSCDVWFHFTEEPEHFVCTIIMYDESLTMFYRIKFSSLHPYINKKIL